MFTKQAHTLVRVARLLRLALSSEGSHKASLACASKVLYACFKKKLFDDAAELKVSQLSAYCAEQTNYHHGEASLHATIIHMAQVGLTMPMKAPCSL